MLRLNQAAVTDHSDQASCRVRTAAETQDINLVAVFVGLGEKLVALNYVALQSGADGAANVLIIPLGSHTLVVPFHLLNPIRAFVRYGLKESTHVGLSLPRRWQIFIGGLVSRPIETNDNSLHKRFSPFLLGREKLGLSILIRIDRTPCA